MTSMYETNMPVNNVVGNNYASDESLGFKEEVSHVLESYTSQGVNLIKDLDEIITSPETKQEFVSNICESLTQSPIFTDASIANEAFYNNYGQRVEQLLENSLRSIATESAMLGYAPIVAYNPFFLKKQWIACIFKDVLMTEVPQSPVINLAFEKRYLVDSAKNEYPIPEVNYDDEIMKRLTDEATGLNIKSTPFAITNFKPAANILSSTYIDGLVAGDPTAELTADFRIVKVYLKDSSNVEHEVPCNIKVDITTHQFTNGSVKYDVTDASGAVTETITDTIVGNVDFKTGKALILSESDKVTKIVLSGKTANRWNNRSLDVVRRVEQLQYVMPESGPRLNSAITVEDAADALALQKIDVIADNVDVMGRTLADLEDYEIRMFLDNSFEAQENAGVGPHGYDKLTVVGGFDAKPYESFTNNITDWMKDSREYFERIIEELKDKLKTTDAVVTVVAHPSLVRFLNNGINWVFSDDTQISGMKISYNFGIYTTAQDRVHIITTRYMKREAGLKFVVIPTTTELVTFKHYKYNCIIDRNYRNPLYTLTPNIMCTHRTLTFEVLPVQGKMTIDGRELFSPTTLKRATAATGSTTTPTVTYSEVTSPTGNPSTSGYYELVGGSYVASTDTTVDSSKTYYTKD